MSKTLIYCLSGDYSSEMVETVKKFPFHGILRTLGSTEMEEILVTLQEFKSV